MRFAGVGPAMSCVHVDAYMPSVVFEPRDACIARMAVGRDIRRNETSSEFFCVFSTEVTDGLLVDCDGHGIGVVWVVVFKDQFGGDDEGFSAWAVLSLDASEGFCVCEFANNFLAEAFELRLYLGRCEVAFDHFRGFVGCITRLSFDPWHDVGHEEVGSDGRDDEQEKDEVHGGGSTRVDRVVNINASFMSVAA